MIYRFGDYAFDRERNELQHAGELVNAEPKVLEVLHYLLEHRERVVSREELFERCWPETYVSDTALTSCLKRLRQAIGQKRSSPPLIQTIHRRGYRFVAEVTEQQASGPVAPLHTPPGPSEMPLDERPPLWAELQHGAGAAEADEMAGDEPVPLTERRQLTVLSCALNDPDALLARLDPEDVHDVIQAFRATCLEVIERHEGYMAQQLDASLLVYFGYPQAREDDVQRAIYCGLALVEACGEQPDMAMRVGIDTGLMIVTSSPGAAVQLSAVGLPAASAGRLGALTQPNTVAISAATEQLVEGYFDCKEFGAYALTSRAEPVTVYEVRGQSQLQTRLEVRAMHGLTPFVGRDVERALLRERWEQAREGMGQVVVLSGDAGMGKSRLLQALKEDVARWRHRLMECRCSPYYQNTVFYPVVDLIERALLAQGDEAPATKFERLEALLQSVHLPVDDMLPHLAALLSLSVPPERDAPLKNLTPQRQRQRILEVLLSGLLRQTSMDPVLFIVEDLQWADPSTLEYLDLLIAQAPTAAVMVVLTHRSSFEPHWSVRTPVTPLALNRLTQSQVTHMVHYLADDQALPSDVMHQIIDKTDGVPLFVEELTRAVLASEPDTLTELAVPATLHDALMARLDQLGSCKELAQWGAVIGREFSYDLLAGVTSLEEVALQEGLKRLTEAEVVFQRGLPPQARYFFKHALIQDTAYTSILKRQRQAMHKQIAQVLTHRAAATAEVQPEVLAHHYTEAGQHELAIPYWQEAGDRAMAHSAHHEAIGHLRTGLALLATRPETDARSRLELSMQMTLGLALMAIDGYGAEAVAQTYARARMLCDQLGNDAPERFPVLRGLAFFDMVRGGLAQAQEVAEQLLALVQPGLNKLPFRFQPDRSRMAFYLPPCHEPTGAQYARPQSASRFPVAG